MGYFFHTFIVGQTTDVTVCFRLVVLLVHLIMGASAGSNLGQMGDTDYLAVLLAHLLHDIRHAVGYLAGDSGIYFVEYNGRKLDGTGYHCFDGEHDAGYFTTRSYGGDALQCPVLIRGKQEVHSIRPVYARLFAGTYLYLETDIGHANGTSRAAICFSTSRAAAVRAW